MGCSSCCSSAMNGSTFPGAVCHVWACRAVYARVPRVQSICSGGRNVKPADFVDEGGLHCWAAPAGWGKSGRLPCLACVSRPSVRNTLVFHQTKSSRHIYIVNLVRSTLKPKIMRPKFSRLLHSDRQQVAGSTMYECTRYGIGRWKQLPRVSYTVVDKNSRCRRMSVVAAYTAK